MTKLGQLGPLQRKRIQAYIDGPFTTEDENEFQRRMNRTLNRDDWALIVEVLDWYHDRHRDDP